MQTSGQPNYEAEFKKFLDEERHLALMVRSRAAKYGDSKVAVRHKAYGEWEGFTWKQFGDMIDDCALGLLEMGVKEGEMVGIFAPNRVEWAVADYASFAVRGVSVPVYATNSAAELQYIVDHAEIRILFVSNQEHYDKAVSIMKDSPSLEKIIVFHRGTNINESNNIMMLDDFLKLGRSSGREQEYRERLARADSEDLSTLIYTSGTTGVPKGVMLNHRNWLAMLFSTGYYIPIQEDEVNLAFLPLSHVFERAWSYFTLCRNAQVDYCHDTKALTTFLVESRPHYMCSVPRLWEKIHATVIQGLEEASPAKRRLFNWALEVGGQVQVLKKAQKPIPGGLKIKHALAEKLVLSKIQALFGGRNKVYNCGGSAFSGEISEFFWKAGVLLLQGYGMTECFVICVSNPIRNKFGTCGPAVPMMDVRISAEGEIQARGPSMMLGYYKNPELSAEMLTDDGYIKTGDVGFIDDEGYITITDRIKDLFKTSGGKYVAPQHIETLLKEDYFFEQAVAVGDNRKCVCALVVPFFEGLENWARQHHIEFKSRSELLQNPKIVALYRDRIDHQTRDLGQVEKVKHFKLLDREFTQEDGELTPTLKIKRRIINDKYKDVIEEMYRELEQQNPCE